MQKAKKIYAILLVCFLSLLGVLVAPQVYAEGNNEEGHEENKVDPGAIIMHHIADDYQWEFWEGATVYLPVILYSANEGLDIFSSKHLIAGGHGEHNTSYKGYRYDHGSIVPVNSQNKIYDFSITKNVASMFVSILLMCVVFFTVARSYKKNEGKAPSGIQSFFEPIIVFIRDEIAKPNIGKKKYERYMPYLLTLFFFIWFNNLLGLMPGGANVTGNIAVTLVLAFLTLLITVFSGNKNYWSHIFNTPGVPKWLLPIMIIVELIGVLTKPFSLMVRLFANITAGHIIILSLLSLIFIFKDIWFAVGPLSVAFSTFMNFLELFVAILQAYIFTLLSAMYFGMAVEEHNEYAEI